MIDAETDTYVSYDPSYRLALINGPGGFTQLHISRRAAEALASALKIPFHIHDTGIR